MNSTDLPRASDGRMGWLWRHVGRLVLCVVFVVFHHAWFDVPQRGNWLMIVLDAFVMLGVARGIVWATSDSPNTADQRRSPE